MNCEYFEPLISDLVDGELSPGQSKDLQQHLNDCPQCREIHSSFSEMNQLYSQIKAPAAQKEKILASIKGAQRSSKRGLNMFGNSLITKNLSIAAFVVLSFMTIYIASALKDSPVRSVLNKPAPKLPAVGSYKNLKNILLANAQVDRRYINDGVGITFGGSSPELSMLKSAPSVGSDFPHSGYATKDESHSKTNVQVQGVDESDIVKTDGQYIYQVNSQEIKIIEARPAKDMKVASSIKLADKEIIPGQVYLDEKYLTIIGSSYQKMDSPDTQGGTEPDVKRSESLVHPGDEGFMQEMIKVRVYDITDKSSIKKVRELEVTGGLISSRKIGSALYLVANKYLDAYRIMEQKAKKPFAGDMPAYKDSKGSNKYETQGFNDIRYLPGSQASNYMIVAGINLDNLEEEAKVSSYLGAGENIYASRDNLYVAVRETEEQPKTEPAKNPDQPTDNEADDRKFIQIAPAGPVLENTAIYKFTLSNGEATYSGKGKVPGTILNQFSMDESGDFFRIATTKGDMWAEDSSKSQNNMYILNNDLKTIGKLEGLAPGERIYSARFMGDRAYMVTFRQTDPLYVIDLKEASSPKVLGELKIPGFSNYLHPYDENHIIGFGKDADENTGVTGGMKIAMFDVSDVNKPVEKFKTLIGDRGTDSPLLHDHKALLFDKENDLMAFPITVMEKKGASSKTGAAVSGPAGEISILPIFDDFGQPTFSGAYVYNVSPESGLKLKGKISHLSDAENTSQQHSQSNWEKSIDRIIRIDDSLYTVSRAQVSAHSFADLKEIKSVSLGK